MLLTYSKLVISNAIVDKISPGVQSLRKNISSVKTSLRSIGAIVDAVTELATVWQGKNHKLVKKFKMVPLIDSCMVKVSPFTNYTLSNLNTVSLISLLVSKGPLNYTNEGKPNHRLMSMVR